MLVKWKCPKVDASVARPGVRFAAWSAAVCIAGPGAPGVRTGGREKKECPSEDASVARPGVWVATWTAAAGIAEDRSHPEKGRVA